MLYGIQWYDDWSDHPGWDDRDADEDKPVRFPSPVEAQASIDAAVDALQKRRHDGWIAKQLALAPQIALYEERKRCLIDNGLWDRPEDGVFSPIIGHGLEAEPTRDASGYRVVLDAGMDTPVAEWETPA